MSKIVYSSVFEKEYKRLRKRYKSLPDDLKALVSELREDMADVDAAIIMVAIYDKSEKENLTDKELLDLARKCGLDSIG